ncbi:MAG: tetraacyldisaccharide 4'-kinase [Rickettsiales bacterium]|nr:tetraacyldisaccharide 4'-kinase [Rickettsiales bacterium]
MLKTPKFWTEKNLISCALLPASWLYFLGFLVVKFFTKTTKISKPVICIGNVIAGGSGKTPTAIAIGKILHEMSADFAFLSRGYMSDGSSFLQLQKDGNNQASQVGDEPMLLIETAPTFVATNRLFGAKQIEKNSAFKMVVLDDGMQNDSLFRDYTILVVDGKIGFGNDFLIPAGPMRETLAMGLKKTDLVVVIGEAEEKLLQKFVGKKLARAKIIPTNLNDFLGKKLVAFCGLAYPQKFFSLLEKNGVELVESIGLPDHYLYRDVDLEALCKIAAEKNASLVTTKKDWMKFSPNFQKKISYLNIELEFEDKELIKSELKKFL